MFKLSYRIHYLFFETIEECVEFAERNSANVVKREQHENETKLTCENGDEYTAKFFELY